MSEVKQRWRDYQTPAGHRPVKEFLMSLSDDDRAAVLEAMRDVRENGKQATSCRKLRGRIWEVRVDQGEKTYRILFASTASKGRVLLSLEGFAKKTQKTPKQTIQVAENRLSDWETRGDKGD